MLGYYTSTSWRLQGFCRAKCWGSTQVLLGDYRGFAELSAGVLHKYFLETTGFCRMQEHYLGTSSGLLGNAGKLHGDYRGTSLGTPGVLKGDY